MSEPDYKKACIEQEREITDLLGEALYGHGPEDLPLWGDHVAVTLAMVAARRLRELSLALKEIQSGALPIHMAQLVAHAALQRSPTADNTIRDARRYQALRNHAQVMDTRMDATGVYRVCGIPGRFQSFDAAVDSLVKKEEDHANRPRPWRTDASPAIKADAAHGSGLGDEPKGDVHDGGADRGAQQGLPRSED